MQPQPRGNLRDLPTRRTRRAGPAERLTLLGTGSQAALEDFARDVRAGLTAAPKRLSCAFLYDARGSALFEQICTLPEYYLTRAETEILERHARGILDAAPPDLTLVELGSGSATKTRIVIEELLRRNGALRYVPIDISCAMLEASASGLLEDYPALEVVAVAAEYRAGLHALGEAAPGPKLVLWLGSNVGNFERKAAVRFLREIGSELSPADRLLIGVDLRKDRRTLEQAYDDAQGVTARFNLNLLARINAELGGRFDLSRFRHRAVYDEAEGRVEIYIDSLVEQRVRIEALELDVAFAAGEPIHTENSYKYALREIDALAEAAGFGVNGRWLDAAERFSLSRFVPRA
jgi:dimethylhistidine N-methyltransferase